MNYENLLVGIKNVSPIVERDQPVYQEFFRTEMKFAYYGNSWSYITQACRAIGNCGYKYLDGGNLQSIGAHDGHFVIVRPLGSNVVSTLRHLAVKLQKRSKRPVYVKHLAPGHAADLLGYGDFVEMHAYPWDRQAKMDDASFPEVVIVLRDLVLQPLDRVEMRKIRWQMNRFRKSCHRSVTIRLEPCHPEQHAVWGPQVLQMLLRWAKERTDRVGAYANMVEFPSKCAYRYLLRLGEEARGFYVFERIGEQDAGCYASVCHYDGFPGLSEVAMMEVLTHLHFNERIERVNLGGSELESLHRYRLKFGQVNGVQPVFAVYGVSPLPPSRSASLAPRNALPHPGGQRLPSRIR